MSQYKGLYCDQLTVGWACVTIQLIVSGQEGLAAGLLCRNTLQCIVTRGATAEQAYSSLSRHTAA